MKMYILVKRDVPLGVAMVAVAHASLGCFLAYQSTESMQAWVQGTFYKCVCSVTPEEFERAKAVENSCVITESSLGGQEVAVAFAPREEWPKMFKFFKLYR